MFFSFYRHPVSTTIPERVIDPKMCAKYILAPYAMERTDLVRATLVPEERKAVKRQQLDFITAGGVFRRRQLNQLSSISGAMLLDFDHVADIPAIKRWCVETFPTIMCWISPSGEGIKVLCDITDDMLNARIPIDIPTTSHNVRERAAEVYKYLYRQAMELAIERWGNACGADMGASDITRATYLSADYDCYINPIYLLQ